MTERLSASERARLNRLMGKLRTTERQREYFHLPPATLRWAAVGAPIEPDMLEQVRRILGESNHG